MPFKVVALAGGVGGAKMADGLAQLLPSSDLTVIVNTGDDFRYMGLSISPDLDTVCYALAGLENPLTGWGRRDESWQVMIGLSEYPDLSWFQLGDRDLATHLVRTELLQKGVTLGEITQTFCDKWGVPCLVLPMTNHTVHTKIVTMDGEILDFQEYFVHQRWQPVIRHILFEGAKNAAPTPGTIEAIEAADVVVICPSNPLVSIDPILSVPGIKDSLCAKPIIAVSPIVGGAAVKGPLAKMISEMYQVAPSAAWVAEYYQQNARLDGYILDELDATDATTLNRQGIICKTAPSIMKTRADRLKLAEEVVGLCQHWLNR